MVVSSLSLPRLQCPSAGMMVMMSNSHYRDGEVNQTDGSQHFDRGCIFGALKLLAVGSVMLSSMKYGKLKWFSRPVEMSLFLWNSNAKVFNMHASS